MSEKRQVHLCCLLSVAALLRIAQNPETNQMFITRRKNKHTEVQMEPEDGGPLRESKAWTMDTGGNTHHSHGAYAGQRKPSNKKYTRSELTWSSRMGKTNLWRDKSELWLPSRGRGTQESAHGKLQGWWKRSGSSPWCWWRTACTYLPKLNEPYTQYLCMLIHVNQTYMKQRAIVGEKKLYAFSNPQGHRISDAWSLRASPHVANNANVSAHYCTAHTYHLSHPPSFITTPPLQERQICTLWIR